jgi:hypothetical protein
MYFNLKSGIPLTGKFHYYINVLGKSTSIKYNNKKVIESKNPSTCFLMLKPSWGDMKLK